MPDAKALLTIQQVADYLQLNQSTVYQWAQKGRLPAIKLGGRWRFRGKDLEAWLDAQTSGPEFDPVGTQPMLAEQSETPLNAQE